ncbi:MAG: adenylosuccinate synthetase, partial [Planctomycetes bacterium]|nr:adenylosuccinate synthetase [Planctomycetota bacterium]
GWFDAVAVRHSARLNGVDELALMLLDVLSVVEELKICTAYEMDGRRIDYFPGDSFLLEKCRPIYETVPGWNVDVSNARQPSDLPVAARNYVDRLSQCLELPISIISVGPDREQTIVL